MNTNPICPDQANTTERGFVLVLVLWGVGLVMIMVSAFSVSSRTHGRIAANLANNAQARYAAESGVHLAIVHLLKSRHAPGRSAIPLDGSPHSCRLADETHLQISVTNEGGKIDLNAAPPQLLLLLFRGLGLGSENAASIVDAIVDFRDRDNVRNGLGAERAEYQKSGKQWLPKNGPFSTVGELEQVHGVTPHIYRAVRAHLTVSSLLSGLDLSASTNALKTILQNGTENSSIPRRFSSTSQRSTYSVRSMARLRGGATFLRAAVVEFPRSRRPTFRFLSWQHEQLSKSEQADLVRWSRLGQSRACPNRE